MRTCTKCKRTLPLNMFWNDSSKKHGKVARCKDCRGVEQKAYREKNKDKQQEKNKERYWKNKHHEQERHLIRKYGITIEDYEKMLMAQHGKCKICGAKEPDNKRLDVDHDHKTGFVRGLLCTSCNRMIGHSGDNPIVLKKAAEYLKSSRRSRKKS